MFCLLFVLVLTYILDQLLGRVTSAQKWRRQMVDAKLPSFETGGSCGADPMQDFAWDYYAGDLEIRLKSEGLFLLEDSLPDAMEIPYIRYETWLTRVPKYGEFVYLVAWKSTPLSVSATRQPRATIRRRQQEFGISRHQHIFASPLGVSSILKMPPLDLLSAAALLRIVLRPIEDTVRDDVIIRAPKPSSSDLFHGAESVKSRKSLPSKKILHA